MEKEHRSSQMALNTMVNGKTIWLKDKELFTTLMVTFSRGVLLLTKPTDKALTLIAMDKPIQVTGKTISRKAKEKKCYLMEVSILANSREA